jgi:hypothetical protein
MLSMASELTFCGYRRTVGRPRRCRRHGNWDFLPADADGRGLWIERELARLQQLRIAAASIILQFAFCAARIFAQPPTSDDAG